MIKFLIIVLAMVVLGESQRPPYAGTANRYPVVLPRFQEEQDAAEAAAIANRNQGENDVALPVTPSTTTTSTIPPDLPIDALGDVDLVNRIKTWPREKQPFWYINAQQIEAHRQQPPPQTVRPQVNPRSFFAG